MRPTPFIEQLLESLELAFIVAENERRGRASEEGAEAVEVPVYLLRWKKSDLKIHALIAKEQPREPFEPGCPGFRGDQDGVATGDLFTEPARDVEMVLGLVPCSPNLVVIRARRLLQNERVRG